MGFFDCRCAVTGVSLKRVKAYLILIRDENGFVPVSLPILGKYNRIGSIDMIVKDAHTEHLASALGALVTKRDLVFSGDALWTSQNFSPAITGAALDHDLERLLQSIERACTIQPETSLYRGARLLFMMVSARVYESIVQNNSPTPTAKPDLTSMISQAFGTREPALYQGLEDSDLWREKFASFLKFRSWFEAQKLPYRYHSLKTDGSQHSEGQEKSFFSKAKKRFAEEPLIVEALEQYAADMDWSTKAPPPPLPRPPKDRIGAGSRVKHPVFGEGSVTAIEDGKLNIRFDDKSQRKLMTSFITWLKP